MRFQFHHHFASFRFPNYRKLGYNIRFSLPRRAHYILLLPTAICLSQPRVLAYNDVLKPDPSGDTFEMGLYIASQKELRELSKHPERVKTSRNCVSRFILYIVHQLDTKFLEPIQTVLRFFTLSAVFVPVLLAYPITYFGHTVSIHGNTTIVKETYGSLIWYQIVRRALEFAGPTFIKLGQWAGSRTDIFAEGLCLELCNLHSNAKPHSLKYTKEQIVKALGVESFDDIFEEFDAKTLGCGAVAQVYVGKLTDKIIKQKQIHLGPDQNKWCAVKVVHPKATKQISRDLKIMKFFAVAIDMLPTMEWLSLPTEVEQFSVLMNLQLDLRIEVNNLRKFNENFEGDPCVKFPQGFPELTSRNVLFEEYIHGFPMEMFLKVKKYISNPGLCQKVSSPFIRSFLKMMILDDFIHSDLHAGNIMIRFLKTDKSEKHILSTEAEMFEVVNNLRRMHRDNDPKFIDTLRSVLTQYTPQICFIDTGLITELNDRNRVNFIALFNALALFNGYRAGELMIERSRTPETAIDKELFAIKVEKLVNNVRKRTFTLGNVSIGDLLHQMLTMVRSHHVRMEGDFVSVVVAILLLEGIGRQLDPDLDLFASSLPFLREFGMKREHKDKLQAVGKWPMIKTWLGLELRQFVNLSVKQIDDMVKTDQLCPSY
ncbi:Cqd1p Ecym_7093 [Eremothecium cymbalariae DBVPG|uniref:ABC1 atypical kinase-like domain-containing protein n=1 Tax=Eremothecium cymbalariae (strain CBS 270.75 / DBVPG 7215 / KCTC 17166 / NRRL Y-17582) TaxID=931890 RepID=G8JVT0_ERECY|nr:hypothetical protein Ecym_7093 [Eremothecium cymbalariae DBVPG\